MKIAQIEYNLDAKVAATSELLQYFSPLFVFAIEGEGFSLAHCQPLRAFLFIETVWESGASAGLTNAFLIAPMLVTLTCSANSIKRRDPATATGNYPRPQQKRADRFSALADKSRGLLGFLAGIIAGVLIPLGFNVGFVLN